MSLHVVGVVAPSGSKQARTAWCHRTVPVHLVYRVDEELVILIDLILHRAHRGYSDWASTGTDPMLVPAVAGCVGPRL